MADAAIIVCGGRDFIDAAAVSRAIRAIRDKYADLYIITGGARGADTLANDCRVALGIDGVVVPADWDKHGRSAGPKRNAAMLDLLQRRHEAIKAVVAFPGGSGTENMMSLARAAKVPVWMPGR